MSWRAWADLRAPEFAALPEAAVAVLPTAAIEQHGPHLPVGTDALIMEGMLAEAARMCPDDLHLLALPVQAVGKSNEHLWAAGTLSLSAETALRAWLEVAEGIARAGIRRVLLVNSHGGNLDLVSILARELRVRHGMLAVKCQWMGFGAPEGLFSEREGAFGIHGGDRETSLMLHFRPETVDMGAARDFPSTAEGPGLPPVGPVSYGWIASDLGAAGVVGEADRATAAKGAAAARHQAEAFLRLARQVAEAAVPEAPTGWRGPEQAPERAP
jgi:creatinine amidohydrolase